MLDRGIHMDDQMAALASTAASTVVSALTTDAWERARTLVRGLWERHRPAEADDAERDVADARALLLGAGHRDHTDRADARAGGETDPTAAWEERFRRLLDADPAAAAALTALVDELAGRRPGEEGANGTAATRTELRAEARDSAQVFMAGRDITNIRLS